VSAVYQIVPARPRDLSLLPAIELAAAALLEGHAPASVLNETTSEPEFREAQNAGRLWVALSDDVPVGFAQAIVMNDEAIHLKEIDVDPAHGRRGLGTRLVKVVCDWAAHGAYQAVTLTTFGDLAWNLPFYARLGFEVLPQSEWDVQLAAIMADEVGRGLDPSRRVVMRFRVPQ
jgi:GNAT superfamily N-acetyltransferase